MRKIYILFFLLSIICVGCSKSIEYTYIPDVVISDNNLDEEIDAIGSNKQSSDDSVIYDKETEDDENENDLIKPDDKKISFIDYMDGNNLDYFGKVIYFTPDDNVYTNLLDSIYDKFSLVFDLDNDGKEEAFVCDVIEYDDKSIRINSLYFVDEQMNMNIISSGDYIEFNIEQYLLKNEEYSFVTMNGYEGVDPVGHILSFINDEWVIITDELLKTGHKFFLSENEILWIRSGYMNCYDIDEDADEGFWNGRSYIPYFYKIENGELVLITSEEKNINELNEIAVFNVDEYSDVESVQFLLCENGELEVNYVIANTLGFNFYSDVYYIDDNTWVYKYTVAGYYVPDPTDYSKTDWEFIEEL